MTDQLAANFWPAIYLTAISGLTTCLGGVFVICNGSPTFSKLGHMMSFSAGVMMFISFLDLLPDAIESIGFLPANLYFFAGILFFITVTVFVPEPTVEPLAKRKGTKASPAQSAQDKAYLMSVGMITAIGISLHNFPEGIAVYFACLRGTEMGIPLVFAIAAHNIPEGIAVASPIYHSTGSKWQAFLWSLLSGACEPAGAIVVGVLFHNYFTDVMVHSMMAFVAGIMVLISIQELIPASLKYISPTASTYSNIAGMFTVMIGVQLISTYV